MTYTVSFLEYLEYISTNDLGVLLNSSFLLRFLISLDLLFPSFLPRLSVCLLQTPFCSLASSIRILSPNCILCSALDCQTGVSSSFMNYGNKETFRFFKTEAINKTGTTALRTASNSQCRGLDNRM